jgi:hypothetical protein
LLLDIGPRGSEGVATLRPAPRGDTAQHANQLVDILSTVLDAETHAGDAGQREPGEQGHDQSLELREQGMNLEQTLDQEVRAVATESHADSALRQFPGAYCTSKACSGYYTIIFVVCYCHFITSTL